MTMIYGVPIPRGVHKTWEANSMTRESGGAMLRAKGVADPWGDPVKCVAWFDTFGRCRACVGHYANGRAVLLRADMNGKWKLTFGSAPCDSGSGPTGRRHEVAPGEAPQSGLSASEGIAQTPPPRKSA